MSNSSNGRQLKASGQPEGTWIERVVIKRLQRIWRAVTGFYYTIEPVRFNIIVLGLVFVAFCLVPQGKDILVGFAEDGGVLRGLGFLTSLIYLCLANWYWPRFLLNCEFAGVHARGLLSEGCEDEIRIHTPRVLGIGPAAVVGVGFLITAVAHADGGAVNDARGNHWLLAIGCFALALILYWAFFLRRKWLGEDLPRRDRERGESAKMKAGHQFKRLADAVADRQTAGALALFIVPPLVFFLAFLVFPGPSGLALTSASVVLLGLAALAFNGAALMYFGHRYKLPIILLLALLAIGASFNNDDHDVRTLGDAVPARPTIEAQLKIWNAKVAKGNPGQEGGSVIYIVATEGGGIRAAYWTSLVLSSLQDASIKSGGEVFSDHLFAISGVSGGSFGGAAFTAFVADPTADSYADRTKAFMQRDFLAPLVGRMLSTDLWQRFIPVPINAFDRGTAFEEAWEKSWEGSRRGNQQRNIFAESVMSLSSTGRTGELWIPGLFLNGTNPETGGRIVTCPWDFSDPNGRTFIQAIDGVLMAQKSIRLSTAAHASARFTYFNPPGRFPNGTHVVDGGYFENSGGETARDILARVLQYNKANGGNIKPYLIVIRNGVRNEKPPDRSHNHGLSELAIPVSTLWNTRSAHADLSLGELEKQPIISATMEEIPESSFYLYGNKVPLGWTLSNASTAEMEVQIENEIKGSDGQRLLLSLKSTAK